MKIGDRVSIVPLTFGTGVDRPGEGMGHAKEGSRPQPGTVTYVSRRWYQVTFDCGIRECFFFDVTPEPMPGSGRPCKYAYG